MKNNQILTTKHKVNKNVKILTNDGQILYLVIAIININIYYFKNV